MLFAIRATPAAGAKASLHLPSLALTFLDKEPPGFVVNREPAYYSAFRSIPVSLAASSLCPSRLKHTFGHPTIDTSAVPACSCTRLGFGHRWRRTCPKTSKNLSQWGRAREQCRVSFQYNTGVGRSGYRHAASHTTKLSRQVPDTAYLTIFDSEPLRLALVSTHLAILSDRIYLHSPTGKPSRRRLSKEVTL